MQARIKALIIDDEQNSREFLDYALQHLYKRIQVVGHAIDVSSGVDAIVTYRPDVVFLDIEMPGGNGFDILSQCQHIPFRVIFITGYDQFAIKAIKFSALDYLLKPVNLDELRTAIYRIQQTDWLPGVQQYQLLKDHLETPQQTRDKLILTGQKGYKLLQIEQINYIEADGNYARFHFMDGSSQLAVHPMGYYESLLPASQFFRTHKSYLINLSNVQQYINGRGGEVLMTNGQKVAVAIRRKTAFLNKLKSHGKI